jgi:hypothetical protein
MEASLLPSSFVVVLFINNTPSLFGVIGIVEVKGLWGVTADVFLPLPRFGFSSMDVLVYFVAPGVCLLIGDFDTLLLVWLAKPKMKSHGTKIWASFIDVSI